MMITGLTLATLGVTLLGVGTGVYAAGNTCNASPGPAGPSGDQLFLCGAHTGLTTGMALMASGLIGMGLGLPLTFLGAAEVPRAEAGSVFPRATVAVGPSGVTVALHF